MDYRHTIDYLYSQLPVFHKTGIAAYRPDLGNITALCSALGNPHQGFPSVHVGGTNGKGSVSHMLAAILHQAGYKTGLYTSPHLLDFRERIRINGAMIPEEAVVSFVKQNHARIESLSPSFFEVSAAMAFWYFDLQKVDIALIEVGMGGRLDSTNIISPELSVITNIGMDHVHVLGHSLPEIAREKAGIIKQGIPVVVGEFHEETALVFQETAQARGASLHFASRDWEVRPLPGAGTPPLSGAGATPLQGEAATLNMRALSAVYGKSLELQLDLTGGYQLKNVKTVLSAVEELKGRGFNLRDEHTTAALRRVRELTGFSGRWQILGSEPLTICDTGHNEDGIRAVLQQLAATPYEKLHIVFGMVNDKDVEKILSMLPPEADYFFCQAAVPRAMDADLLYKKALAAGLTGKAFPSVRRAIEAAKKAASVKDLIFIGGSTFVVAEAI